ncbi:hypothetical protein KS4_33480 [Poriferisphaera corsica]|uniref:Carbohydrate-binding domain-containing protein n=1 Tax=Poriferisphaera corsica TaxID=2528020 RepID=A0A517YYJ5_9BACT|nr:sugar-binding protein [Poriferisphaera corsica]QDU35267.1 hypothetical protein KS4_33480 [Poriferisphaera corsica]
MLSRIALMMVVCGCVLMTGCANQRIGGVGSVAPDCGCDVAVDADTLIAKYQEGIVVDGELDEWRDVEWQWVDQENGVLDEETKALDGGKDLWFGFAVRCDDDALYVAVQVYDDVYSTDSCEVGEIGKIPSWADDTLEVFIDGDHNKIEDSRTKDRDELKYGGEFALVANGSANSDYSGYPRTFGQDAYWSGATKVRGDDGAGYVVKYEMRLAWGVMGGIAGPGKTIGFTLSMQDDDGKGRESALYWKGASKWPFRNESKFGNVYLERRNK